MGKSTLVNRLTATRETVVHAQPGVTRDRKELIVEWGGEPPSRSWTPAASTPATSANMQREIADQARAAIAEADLVLFLVDARAGIGAGRRGARGHPAPLAQAGHPDRRTSSTTRARDAEALEFHRLGLGDPLPLSALHGVGTGDLLDVRSSRRCAASRAPSASSVSATRSASRSSAARTSASRRS